MRRYPAWMFVLDLLFRTRLGPVVAFITLSLLYRGCMTLAEQVARLAHEVRKKIPYQTKKLGSDKEDPRKQTSDSSKLEAQRNKAPADSKDGKIK